MVHWPGILAPGLSCTSGSGPSLACLTWLDLTILGILQG